MSAKKSDRRQIARGNFSHGFTERAPLAAQAGHIQRRSIAQIGHLAGGLLQPFQKLIDVFEFGIARQQTFLLQRVGDLLYDMTPGARHVGQRSHDPHRRSAKCQQARQLDTVPSRPPQQKIAGQLASGRIYALHLAHLLDHEAQRNVHHHLVRLGSAHRGRNRYIADLANQSAGQCRSRAHHAFGQRDDVTGNSGGGLGATSLGNYNGD